MKLLGTHIYGFGKFYQQSFSFEDGIHVIYGPNEAGKSTLHTFLGSMLFGLERGRGRAAKHDLYSRYLPWEHDATYGGTLTFETEDDVYELERNFRQGKRTCILTGPHETRALCQDSSLPDRCYEGLTEALYYNTLSIRQLGSAPDSTLAEELGKRLTGLYQSGSDAIDYPKAVLRLKAEQRRLEHRLDPTLESSLLDKKALAYRLNQELDQDSVHLEKTSIEERLQNCMDRLSYPDNESGSLFSPDQRSSGLGLLSILCSLIFILCLAGSLYLWSHGKPILAGGMGALAVLTGLCRLLLTRKRTAASPLPEASDDPDPADPPEQLRSLQNQLRKLDRLEWEYDQKLQQLQQTEEELEQLNEKQKEQDQLRQKIQAVGLALSTLQKLAAKQQDSLGPRLNSSLSQILSGLTDGAYDQVYVDDSLTVTVRAGNRTVSLDSLSRGTIEQIHLAMRLAVIDVLFPQGGMPLLLDDCFLAYDDLRLKATLEWLAENYSGQIFIFTCQRRELDILRHERIPYTQVEL